MATILIVDDHDETRFMLARLLRRFGHTTEALPCGEDCLARLASGDLPHLLLLDHMMPGACGLDVLIALRQSPRTRAVPVVMFSAVQDDGFRRRALAAGANACWVKGSFDFGQLAEAIEIILAGRGDHTDVGGNATHSAH